MTQENDLKQPNASIRLPRPGFLLMLCLTVGMGAGVIFDRVMLLTFVPSDAVSNFRIMAEAWNTIERYYVDRASLKPTTLTYGAISGMVNALGDTGHSEFLPPGMVKELRVAERGELKGIGVQVSVKTGHVVIVAPIDDSPAQRAGLRSGDIIMTVDGRSISGLPLEEIIGEISGAAGTSVKLGVAEMTTHRIREVTLVREAIKLKNVTWQRLPGTEIADIRIASFSDNVSKDLRAALSDIQGQRFQGLILDLRNNPGGVLDEAVSVASQFLAGGNVLLVKDAGGNIKSLPVLPGGLATNLPMAVLINRGSASASEIVAGALSDAHRAELIGETTFGTGTVLNEFPLTDGSALMLAVKEWLTPSGRSFWHKGITPELSVALPAEANPLIPAAARDMTPAQLQSSDDQQLLSALKWVTRKIEK